MGVWDWACWVGGGLLAIAGVWLFLRAMWPRRKSARACLGCGYDMAGVPGLTCPECGRGAKSELELGRPRRKWGLALASVMVLLVAIGVGLTPRVRDRGWMGATPTWMLAVAMNVYDTADHRLAIELMFRARAQGRFDGIIEGAMIERHARWITRRDAPDDNLTVDLLRCVPTIRGERVVEEMLEAGSSETVRVRGVWIAVNSVNTPAIQDRFWELAQHDSSIAIRTHALKAISFDAQTGRLAEISRVLEIMCSPASMDAACADEPAARLWREYVRAAVRSLETKLYLHPRTIEACWRVVHVYESARHAGLAVLAKSDPTRIDELCELSHRGPSEGVALMLQTFGTTKSPTPAMRACLISHLKNADASCREWAAWGLEQHGGGDRVTIEALSAMIRTESTPGGLSSALSALVKLGASEALVDELACGAAAGSTEASERVRARFLGLGRRIPECLKK